MNYNDKIIEQQRRTQFGFHQMNVLSRRIICCSIDIEMTHLSRKTIKNGERKTDKLTDSILIFNKNGIKTELTSSRCFKIVQSVCFCFTFNFRPRIDFTTFRQKDFSLNTSR